MRPETAKWIAATSVQALLCRDLRHAWPRPTPAAARRRPGQDRRCPPSTQLIMWRMIADESPTSRRILERTMLCEAGCGVRRLETFVVREGRLVRTGVPKFRYPPGYRRAREEPDTPLEPLDADVLRGSIVARLYPGLQW